MLFLRLFHVSFGWCCGSWLAFSVRRVNHKLDQCSGISNSQHRVSDYTMSHRMVGGGGFKLLCCVDGVNAGLESGLVHI